MVAYSLFFESLTRKEGDTVQAPRPLSDTTTSLEHEVLLETAFGNDELVFLALPVHRDPFEPLTHELIGVDLEIATLPFLLKDNHVVGDRDFSRLVSSPSFLVEEVVVGGTDTAGAEEDVSTDAVTVAQADQFRCL